MPQMAPLNWLTLFLMFSLTFIIYNSLNFYMFTYKSSKFNFSKNIIKTLWKW
uniref:ATP synthase complex subunit 8 n=1 Tax=Cucujoidea sp. 9 KM-2017 TaxID=2219390 RepID=A0A346RJQ4_9CUCU|nr:ATP synthase F0 subunit 8 [Cucujoidea sp. 9 KM-2017]